MKLCEMDFEESFDGVYKPTSFEEAIVNGQEDWCRFGTTKKTLTNRIWRGQSKKWPLHSGAVRRLIKKRIEAKDVPGRTLPKISENVLRTYERKMVYEARREGYGQRNGRRLNDFEVWARLQHHGAATRLVDFTDSFFVALWFACRDQNHLDEEGVVFGVPSWPHEGAVGPFREFVENEELGPVGKVLQTIDEKKKPNSAILYRPSEVSPRIAAQHSVFVLSLIEKKEWSSLNIPKVGKGPKKTKAIIIQPSLKKKMEPYWDRLFSYSERKMFRDLEGFSASHGADKPNERGVTSWHNNKFFDVFTDGEAEEKSIDQ